MAAILIKVIRVLQPFLSCFHLKTASFSLLTCKRRWLYGWTAETSCDCKCILDKPEDISARTSRSGTSGYHCGRYYKRIIRVKMLCQTSPTGRHPALIYQILSDLLKTFSLSLSPPSPGRQRPEMCCKLSAEEAVSTEEAEDAAGSVVPAVHPLCLQLKAQLWRFVRRHVRQCRPASERSRAERERLRPHVDVKPVGPLRLADLHRPHHTNVLHLIPPPDANSPCRRVVNASHSSVRDFTLWPMTSFSA